MKKSILNIGSSLSRKEQKQVMGGDNGNLCIDECGPGHPGNQGCSGDRICIQVRCQPGAQTPGTTGTAYYCVNQNPFGGGEM